MFQDHALFPHRDVADNVAFGPRMRGVPPDEIERRVARRWSWSTPGLRRPAGHRAVGRRAAAGRAGPGDRAPPRLLMLDEPLGSLDRALRDRLLDELPDVFAELGCTVLYVTHDQDEALASPTGWR
jgi:thiamine transport system ATP-binding protein